MSIATKKGDDGTTALMYNRRLSKSHPRVEAYGAVDELNAALGLARATALDQRIDAIQADLIILMGELATASEDLPRYVKDGFQLVTAEMAAKLDAIVADIEGQKISFKGWAAPGANLVAATLDMARVTCRRAERRVCALAEAGSVVNPAIVLYLNRLSDALWLMARQAEHRGAK